MRNNAISFATLERVLEGLGFVKAQTAGPQQVFEHAPSHSVFLFRAYKPRERVTTADLMEVRKILDEKGIIEPDALEGMLHQNAA